MDNSVLGVPPELAAVSGLSVARAMAAPGLTLVARGIAGTKAVAAQAAPVVKYQLIKSGLEGMGVPSVLAIPAAMVASGYKKTAAETGTAAADEGAVSAPGFPKSTTSPPPGAVLVPPAAPPPAVAEPASVTASAAQRATRIP